MRFTNPVFKFLITFLYISAVTLVCTEISLVHSASNPFAKENRGHKKIKSEQSDFETYEEWLQAGRDHIVLGEYDEAKNAFKEAIMHRPGHAEAHYWLGITYKDLGEMKYALRALEQAVKIRPDYVEAYYTLALTYVEMGRKKKALATLISVTKLRPDHANAYYHLGELYSNLGKKEEALAAYSEAIRVKPDFIPAHYGRGKIYVRLEDIDAALKEYEILIDLDRRLAYDLFNQIYE